MNRAEHSPQEHSAPHGASRAAISTLSNRGLHSQSAHSVSQSTPALSGRRFLIGLSQRRSASSGRALLAVLALGLVFEANTGAYASATGTWLGMTTLVASTKAASVDAAKAAQPLPANAKPIRAKAVQTRAVSAKAIEAKTVQTVLAEIKLAQTRLAQAEPVHAAPAHASAKVISVKSVLTRPAAEPLAAIAVSKLVHLPVAPRAQLMPRATVFSAPRFPGTPTVNITLVKTTMMKPSSHLAVAATGKMATSTFGSAKMIRIAQLMPGEIAEPTAASTVVTPTAPAALTPNLGGMKKIIDVPSLSLPPLSKPLPVWMQNAAVKVDRLDLKPRLAQNPEAPPVRNPAAPVTNSDRLPNQIEVAVSTFVVLLTTTDLQTVAVADPDVADVAVVNSRSVLLNGKSAGVTSLVIVDGQKIRQYSVRVTPAPGSRPVDVAAAIGLPGVSVRPIKDALVLEGEVGSAEEARRAVEIAGIYSAKVVNQLTIRGQVSQEAGMSAQVRDLINFPGVNVRVSGDTVILTGTVDTPQQIQDAETIARASAKNVINLIKLPNMTPDQVRESLGAVASGPVNSIAPPGQITQAAPLSVRELGGQLVLDGTVGSQSEADIAVSAANRTGLPVVNHIQIRSANTADEALVTAVATAIGRPGVIVRGTAKRLVLEGVVDDTNEAVLAEQVARAFVTPGLGQVDNLLRTKTPVQCNVDISIVELNTTDARQLGVQYGSVSLLSESTTAPTTTIVRDGAGNPVIDAKGNPVTQTTGGSLTRTVGSTFNQGVATAGNGFLGKGSLAYLDPFRARLSALVSEGKGRVLSNPTTTVLSGRTATFQVGGQVPIPASSTIGAAGATTGIIFKDYGILLDIVPNALPNGNVTLRIRTEVSQPDFSIGVTPPGGGSAIPGFSRRSTITEVTVPKDGTVALSGLITADDTRNETRVPLLSKLPIIGSIFRSREFRENKTELVFFVRPRVLPNTLSDGSDAPAAVMAVGENTNRAAQLGNPGLNVFDGGVSIGAPVASP